jgi:hypothetical protein
MRDFLFDILICLLMWAFYCKGYEHGTRKMADFTIKSFKELQSEVNKLKENK